MKMLKLMRPDCEANIFSDAHQIVSAFAARGWEITDQDAVDAWRMYSSASRHTWLPTQHMTAIDLFTRLLPAFEDR